MQITEISSCECIDGAAPKPADFSLDAAAASGLFAALLAQLQAMAAELDTAAGPEGGPASGDDRAPDTIEAPEAGLESAIVAVKSAASLVIADAQSLEQGEGESLGATVRVTAGPALVKALGLTSEARYAQTPLEGAADELPPSPAVAAGPPAASSKSADPARSGDLAARWQAVDPVVIEEGAAPAPQRLDAGPLAAGLTAEEFDAELSEAVTRRLAQTAHGPLVKAAAEAPADAPRPGAPQSDEGVQAAALDTHVSSRGARGAGLEGAVRESAALEAPQRSTLPGIGESVLKSVRYLAGEGERTVHMKLIPESLGELRVTVRGAGETLTVELVSAHAHVRETLHGQLHGLRESLARDGLDVSKISISADVTPERSPHDARPGPAYEFACLERDGGASGRPAQDAGAAFAAEGPRTHSHAGLLNVYV